MPTLARYVASRFIAAFVGSLVILTLVVLVVDMLLNLEDVLAFESELLGVLRYLVIRVSAVYLPYLIPVATFTGAFFSLGSAARHHEIVAMKAGGISPRVAVIPVFIVSGFIAIAALLVNETLTVRASAELRERSGSDLGELELRSGSIWYHTGRYLYNIRKTDGDVAEDVRVLERDDRGRLVRLIRAVRAERLAPHEWRFEGATVRRFDPDQPSLPPQVERSHRVTLRLEEDRSPRLQQGDMAALPVWAIARYLENGASDPRATATLHQRLTSPLLVLLFALLAVPLGLRAERTRTLALPALEGVALLFVFLLAREYAASLAAETPLAAALTPWAVVLAFAAVGAVGMARADT
jgi:LPS export ABC transporter permease LptG